MMEKQEAAKLKINSKVVYTRTNEVCTIVHKETKLLLDFRILTFTIVGNKTRRIVVTNLDIMPVEKS